MRIFNELSEKTVLPIGFAILLLGFVWSASSWSSVVDTKLRAQEERLERQAKFYGAQIEANLAFQKELHKEIQELKLEVSNMNGKLDGMR